MVGIQDFEILIEKGEDGYYIGSVIELPGCHSQAKSMDVLMTRMKEAIELYLESEKNIQPVQFIGIQKLQLHSEINNPLTV
ncbi:MAG: type II toxin-antitoxin system HicB family antitoxin [Candidatus Aenigmarchaeota archaeon]|nr:type II toxin-antitoxin system HicB family antitoxin [Candidatus Aenigmarchaeota archaeon]